MKYITGDIVVFGDEVTNRWGVIERIDLKDVKIGIRSYYTAEGHVDCWVQPNSIIKKLNKYHIGDHVFYTNRHVVAEIIDIRRDSHSDNCLYKIKVLDQEVYYYVNEEVLSGSILHPDKLVEGYIQNDIKVCQETIMRLPFVVDMKAMSIDRVIFNDPATIVIWKDGTKTVVKTAPGETYSEWAGMALCICKKLYGDRFHKIFKEYCPEEDKE